MSYLAAEGDRPEQPFAVYCDSGYRASLAASILQRDGFTEVHNIPGIWKDTRNLEGLARR